MERTAIITDIGSSNQNQARSSVTSKAKPKKVKRQSANNYFNTTLNPFDDSMIIAPNDKASSFRYGDTLCFSRTKQPKSGSFVIARAKKTHKSYLRKYVKEENIIKLVALNPNYESIELTSDFEILGVLCYVLGKIVISPAIRPQEVEEQLLPWQYQSLERILTSSMENMTNFCVQERFRPMLNELLDDLKQNTSKNANISREKASEQLLYIITLVPGMIASMVESMLIGVPDYNSEQHIRELENRMFAALKLGVTLEKAAQDFLRCLPEVDKRLGDRSIQPFDKKFAEELLIARQRLLTGEPIESIESALDGTEVNYTTNRSLKANLEECLKRFMRAIKASQHKSSYRDSAEVIQSEFIDFTAHLPRILTIAVRGLLECKPKDLNNEVGVTSRIVLSAVSRLQSLMDAMCSLPK